MAVEQTKSPSSSHSTEPARAPHPSAPTPGRGRWLIPAVLVLVVVAGVGAYLAFGRGEKTVKASEKGQATAGRRADTAAAPIVEVVTPTPGGLSRVTTQPGSLMAFQSADLFAKVSGYLYELNVDIGSHVKRGDVLAVIDDPEIHKAVELAAAQHEQAKAVVQQNEAHIATAKADAEAARAQLAKAEADVKQYTAQRVYRKSELDRYERLAREHSIEQKLVDEERGRYGASVSAEEAAEANVLAVKSQITAAEARIQQAEADLTASKAAVDVSQAELEKAKVLADYTTITSPYDGVITGRAFFRGDFIRSAADGENRPLLSVARTDRLRVVVRVPDRDVPFVDIGDPAKVHIDALPGTVFEAKVSRFSESEDPEDRTMRTEIDLDNTDGALREGMYGGVTIVLQPASSKTLTVPANSLIEQDGKGNGAVYTVRDGKVHRQEIRIGKDDGVEVEVLSGLTLNDTVIVRYNGSIADGLAVKAEPLRRAPKEG